MGRSFALITAVLSTVAAALTAPAEPPILRAGENTILLTSRPGGRIVRRQDASTNTIPLKDAFNGTDLQVRLELADARLSEH